MTTDADRKIEKAREALAVLIENLGDVVIHHHEEYKPEYIGMLRDALSMALALRNGL